MTRKIISLILILSSVLFIGCKTDEKKEIKEEAQEVPVFEDMTFYKDELGYLFVPTYYEQDYKDISISKDNTFDTAGSLITCLSMINSYYNNDDSKPDAFFKEYNSYFDNNGLCDIEKTATAFLGEDIEVIKEPFNPVNVAEYIKNDLAVILLEIPHTSMYGKNTSYIILTGVTDDYVAVRDPNKANIQRYAIKDVKSSMDEYLYHYTDVITSAGTSSNMYVFKNKEATVDEEEN